jgi:hypothetical protein
MVTSSLSTGRALEKARFFCENNVTPAAKNPVDALCIPK